MLRSVRRQTTAVESPSLPISSGYHSSPYSIPCDPFLSDERKDLSMPQLTLLSSLENALDDMRNTIQAIPDDATLAETEGMIKQASLATMAEAVEIFTTTCTYGQGE